MVNKSKDGSTHKTDEKFNYLSHLFGAILSLYGAVFLIIKSTTPWEYTTFSIYGLTLIILFLASAFHHGFNGKKKTNLFFKNLDYSAVFLLIAGTLTPLTLAFIRTKLTWSVFGIVWFLAIIGIALKFSIKKFPKRITNLLYLSMGFSAAFVAPQLLKTNLLSFILLLLGGIFYTIGSIIFTIEKPNFIKNKFGFHEIWHILVILGAISHYFMIYLLI